MNFKKRDRVKYGEYKNQKLQLAREVEDLVWP
jgi:hypothetical protein